MTIGCVHDLVAVGGRFSHAIFDNYLLTIIIHWELGLAFEIHMSLTPT